MLEPMPSRVTFWPVLPSVTSGMVELAGASAIARSESAFGKRRARDGRGLEKTTAVAAATGSVGPFHRVTFPGDGVEPARLINARD